MISFEVIINGTHMNDLHNNEKYYFFSNTFSVNSESVDYINSGELMIV